MKDKIHEEFDYEAKVPGTVEVEVEDHFFPINERTTVGQLIERLREAVKDATEQGLKGLYVDVSTYITDEWGHKNARLVLYGFRKETPEELAERRKRFVMRRMQDLDGAARSMKVAASGHWDDIMEEASTYPNIRTNLGTAWEVVDEMKSNRKKD